MYSVQPVLRASSANFLILLEWVNYFNTLANYYKATLNIGTIAMLDKDETRMSTSPITHCFSRLMLFTLSHRSLESSQYIEWIQFGFYLVFDLAASISASAKLCAVTFEVLL